MCPHVRSGHDGVSGCRRLFCDEFRLIPCRHVVKRRRLVGAFVVDGRAIFSVLIGSLVGFVVSSGVE